MSDTGAAALRDAGKPRTTRTKWLADKLEDERILGYVLLVPTFLLVVVFIGYPFVLGLWMALTDKVVP